MSDFVNHTAGLSLSNLDLLETGNLSDVTLVVGDNNFTVHRLILANRSEFFFKLFYDNKFQEANETVIKIDTPLVAFKIVLHYIYTGRISQDKVDDEKVDLFDILELSRRFSLKELEVAVIEHFMKNITLENWESLMKTADLFDAENLKEKCWEFVEAHPAEFIEIETFTKLTGKQIVHMFVEKKLNFLMIKKFEAISKWLTANPNGIGVKETLLESLDLTVLSNHQLLKIVTPSKLVKAETILEIISIRDSDVPEQNIAKKVKLDKFKVLVGKFPDAMSNLNSTNYCLGEWVDGDLEIVIQLAELQMVNTISFELQLDDYVDYSIEISTDGRKWTKLIAYKQCFGLQQLSVPPVEVQYVRIIGNVQCKHFHVSFLLDLPTIIAFQF